MSLSSRAHTSWLLLQSSLRVLRDQPRLLVFPAATAACMAAIALFFLAPILIVIRATLAPQDGAAAARGFEPVFAAYGVAIYLLAMFVATFFNVAFYHETLRAFAGESISLRRGWRFALSRVGAILCWSLLAGTVGLVIKSIEERLGWLGRLLMGLVGMAWSVAAVFAIPVIVRRPDANPLAVLRDSAAMLRRTWGEALVGFVGLQLAGALLLAGLLVAVLAAVALTLVLHLGWLPLGLLLAGFAAMVGAAILLAVATDVFRCALYVYASEGVVPQPFTRELLDAGWKVRER